MVASARPLPIAVCAAFAVATIAVTAHLLGSDLRAVSLALDTREIVQPDVRATAAESPSAAMDPIRRYPIQSLRGTPLPELYASLAHWVHPVVGAERKLPLLPEGHYGAERFGVLRVKCGRGHCGADLDGPRGLPIVAVSGGVVLEIDRSRNGKDRRSGRYVRIEHDDGAVTSYMHLDSIVATLQVGARVDGSQQIGTLGSTGVHSANPHLHFALEIPSVAGRQGRRPGLRYFDPAPFLVRATVQEPIDREHLPASGTPPS